jgi:hypothetical protein
MTIKHDTLDEGDAHEIGFRQSGDPGAVGAGVSWIDTTLGTGLWVHKIRNAANNGWETVGSGGGASADFSVWDPEAPNPSASVYDDEFDGSEGAGAPTGWTEYDQGSILTVSEEDYGLCLLSTNGNQICGVYKTAPTWGYSISTRVSILGTHAAQNVKAGIFVSENIAGDPNNCDHTIFAFLSGNAGFGYQIEEYSNYTGYKGGELNSIAGHPGPAHLWIRIRTNSSNQWLVDYSEDGIGWIHRNTHNRDFDPGEIGLFVKTDQANARVVFSNFRVVLTDNQGFDVVNAGDRIDRFLA